MLEILDEMEPLLHTYDMAQRSLIEQRRKQIASYVSQQGTASLQALISLTGSSEYTVRRDLEALEKAGFLVRTHGGAMRKETQKLVWQITSVKNRLQKNRESKMRIALFAASLIADNDSLMIDGGSTTQLMAYNLKDKHNLMVVTNSPGIAEILLDNEETKVIQLGGELQRNTITVSGSEAEEHVRKFFVDKSIIGISGADLDHGCYAAIPAEAEIKRLMIQQSRQSIVLMDSSKFNRKAFSLAFPFSMVNIIVTDTDAPHDIVEKLKGRGVKVYMV